MKNFAERLKAARKMNGYSLQDLADNMSIPISKQALNKYESGAMKPDSEVLSALCKALHVSSDFFNRETTFSIENVNFRKMKKLSAKEQEKVKQKTADFLERYLELENLLGVTTQFTNPINEFKINSLEDIETAVDTLRREWNLGNDPLYNIIELLEDKNIKMFELDADYAFSGLSTYINEQIPVIVLNDHNQLTTVRKRFTALHELGHLLLDLRAFDEKIQEKMCDAFAGAMLVPKEQFIREFGGKRNKIFTNELVLLKSQYGISLPAIMYRASNLNLVSASYLKFFFIRYNQAGKTNEPGEYRGEEKSNRFNQLLYRAVAEEVISISKGAALNNQKLADFRTSLA